MLDWRLIENIARNLKPIKTFDGNRSHPLVLECSNVNTLTNQDLV